MMNIQGIMKQAQAMQKKMEEMQEKLAQEETEGVSGGGMVKVVLNGKFEMKRLRLTHLWSLPTKPTFWKT